MLIRRIRNSTFIRFLWGLMGIYLLNISVDAPDPYPEYIAENLSINDQESIIEFIIEKVLGFDDAIAEYDDHDTEEHSKKKNTKSDFTTSGFSHFIPDDQLLGAAKLRHPYRDAFLAGARRQPDPPPPKA